MNARRFVLVDNTAPQPTRFPGTPVRLLPITWGKPDPKLARGCGTSLVISTPKFRFKGMRTLLRSLID